MEDSFEFILDAWEYVFHIKFLNEEGKRQQFGMCRNCCFFLLFFQFLVEKNGN